METNYIESLKPDWYKYPKKKHAIVFSLIFFIGFLLVTFVATDGYEEHPFHKGNFIFFFLIFIAASKVDSIWKNYYSFSIKRQEAVQLQKPEID